MSFRDKLKATSTKVLKDVLEEEEELLPSSAGGDFLSLKAGLNKVRIYPKHPTEKKYSHIRMCCWLGVEDESGKEVRRTFQNCRIHLGTKNDIIEEYINQAKTKLAASKDADDLKKLKAMTKFEKGSGNASLSFGTTWVVYADIHEKGKEPQFGLLELKKTVRDALNKESIIEDEDEAIEMDPFTDPDEGKPVLITYNKEAKQANQYYTVQLSKNALPLTDAQVEHFEKCKPLSELSIVNVRLEDFEKSIDALRNYDDTFEIGVFEEDSFQEMIETCREQVKEALDGKDDPDTEKEKPAAKKSSTSKKVIEEVPEEDEPTPTPKNKKKKGDKFDEMDREELKRYNKEKEYGIQIFKGKTTDDDIREALREKEAEEDNSGDDAEIPEEPEEVVEKQVKKGKKAEEDDDVVTVDKKRPNLASLKEKLSPARK